MDQGSLVPEFSKRDGFTFDVLLLDLADLGFHFSLLQWGMTESGRCNSVSMCYLSPSQSDPVKAVQLHQLDLAASNVIPDPGLSDEGRQEKMLRSHQGLYARGRREDWFFHTGKRPSGSDSVLDAWRGPRRSYWIYRSFAGQVAVQALFSGFGEEEVLSALGRLVCGGIADAELGEWHDEEQRTRQAAMGRQGNGMRCTPAAAQEGEGQDAGGSE